VGYGDSSMSSLKLKHSGGNSMSIEAPATNPASNLALKLPATIGSANQILKNSGTAGTLGWSALVEDSSGNVGIGTSTPNAGKLVATSSSNGGFGGSLVLENSNGSDTDKVGIAFRPNGSATTAIGSYGESRIVSEYNSGSTNGANHLQFHTHAGDGTVGERMRISSNGAVSVGSTANNFAGSILAANGYYVSAYNGDNLITNASQGGGSATLYIGNAAIQVSSDQRIKKDIVDTTLDATTKLKQVRVVDFKWNDPTDKAEVNRNSRGTWTGCLAQEMVNVFPYTVNAPRKDDNSIDTESERTWGLEYQHLVPALIKGFQEQQAEIETLKTKVAALEAG